MFAGSCGSNGWRASGVSDPRSTGRSTMTVPMGHRHRLLLRRVCAGRTVVMIHPHRVRIRGSGESPEPSTPPATRSAAMWFGDDPAPSSRSLGCNRTWCTRPNGSVHLAASRPEASRRSNMYSTMRLAPGVCQQAHRDLRRRGRLRPRHHPRVGRSHRGGPPRTRRQAWQASHHLRLRIGACGRGVPLGRGRQ